jgi:hypothetical protein
VYVCQYCMMFDVSWELESLVQDPSVMSQQCEELRFRVPYRGEESTE